MSAERQLPSSTSQQLAAVGQVLGELVHDLANEVAALQGWAQVASGEIQAGRLPDTEIQRVVQGSGALGEMLRDVLETVAGQALSPEVVFDPLEVAERTIHQRVAWLSPLTVRLEAELPREVRIAGRASFWTRVLANLLSNAARYARHQVRMELRLARSRGEEQVVLRVEDDGPGVEAGEREAIFRPLVRGAGGEVGLGLSSVAWAVQQLKGTIAYRDDSVLGGAAFEVRVPAAGPLVPRRSREAREEPEGLAVLAGVKLLLVDDDPAVRQALGRLLRRAGAEVRELDPNGEPEEKLVLAVLCTLPEIILLDLRLGARGGLSLWKRMRTDVPQLAERVIFVSGCAPGEADWEDARRSGQPLLAKPFALSQLAATIRELRERG